MKKNGFSLLLAGLGLLLLPLFAEGQIHTGALASEARLLGKTRPLGECAPVLPNGARNNKAKNKALEVPNFQGNALLPAPGKTGPDPLAQAGAPENNFPVLPKLVFEGASSDDSGGVLPPDPVGDVSPQHYIQMTNTSGGSNIAIFDKEGNLVYGPSVSSVLWTDLGLQGLGDPIALWDALASRWILTEFAPFGQTSLLVAVSETSDPLGSWYAYEFQTQSFPDYPKYGIWPDGIYVTTNEFDQYVPIYVLDKAAMYAGAPVAGMQLIDGVPKFGATDAFQVLTPVDLDGLNPPPPGSPHHVVRIHDDAWGEGADRLELWSVQINWSNPGQTVLTGPLEIPLAAFDAHLCDSDIYNCVAQPDGTLVSALQQVVMNRVPYRNFGAYESIVLNFSVDVTGANQAGIRWVELRRTGGQDWQLYQEGTYAPDDQNRFMGSIAQDANGNILLGFSVTGTETLLSLRYTGRLAGAPLGEMNIQEYEFATGQSINFNSRWGDYSCMTVDPTDDRTFWYTGEFMKADGGWGTMITSVQIERDSNDIGVSALQSPQTSGYLTETEPVTVEVRNYGYLPQSGFEITYVFENGAPVTEFIADTLQPDSALVHTFVPTVDLSEIGEYHFLIYTALGVDSFYFNDTLRRTVRQLPRYDASVSGFTGLEGPICQDLFETDILLHNAGVDTLFSALLRYSINGGAVTELEWSGALPSGGTDAVAISSTDFLEGANEILAYALLPNGFDDQNTANDTLLRPFTMLTEGKKVTLRILTDLFPYETTWELYDYQSGALLFSGGPYNQEETLYEENWCLPEGCFEFRIYDSYGDGIQAFGVEGYYQIEDEDGNVLAAIQNANFGTEEINLFCTPGACMLEAEISVVDASSQGASDGQILLSVSNGIPPYKYSINSGASYSSNSFFLNLQPGEYPLTILDKANCRIDTAATVGFVSSTSGPAAPGPRLSIQPNPVEQVAHIQLTGLDGVYVLPFQILDANGVIVHHNRLAAFGGVLSNRINMAPFPAGVYYVRIVHERFSIVEKIIKQ